MKNSQLENEVIKFKNSSKFKINVMILIYKFLKFSCSNTYYFLLSLTVTLLPLIIIHVSLGTIFFGMLVHYIVFYVLIKNKFDKIFKTKDEIYEINEVLIYLNSYLKNKNPN
jgi:hypothetical protein